MRSPETWYVEWDLTTLPIPDLAVACLFGACSNGRTLRYGGIRLRRTRRVVPRGVGGNPPFWGWGCPESGVKTFPDPEGTLV